MVLFMRSVICVTACDCGNHETDGYKQKGYSRQHCVKILTAPFECVGIVQQFIQIWKYLPTGTSGFVIWETTIESGQECGASLQG